jgi:hypothetical protein
MYILSFHRFLSVFTLNATLYFVNGYFQKYHALESGVN